jgi:hypothetical protein
MSPPEAERYTANYIPIVEREFAKLEGHPAGH